MARVCQVTGKGPMVGNNVSHANNKTKRRFLPNLQNRRIFVESENRWVSLRISNAGLRVIDKLGIDAVLADLRLTHSLGQALALVDIRVLDHFVVAGPQVYSFAEHGQL